MSTENLPATAAPASTAAPAATVPAPASPATDVASMSLDERLAYAAELADSGLLPEHFRGKPENVLVAMEWGAQVGLPAVTAMQEIYVVKGRASLSSKSMAMLARKAGHRVRTEGDEQQARCEIVRADDPDYAHTVTYTMADAKRAGLLKNQGWLTQPDVMLRYRAIAACVRLACPEVLGGISYTRDEVEEITARNRAAQTTVASVVPVTPPDPTATVRDYMRRLHLSGEQLRSLTGRALQLPSEQVPPWTDLTGEQRALVLAALAQWDSTGADPTLDETVDGELVDPTTGEIIGGAA